MLTVILVYLVYAGCTLEHRAVSCSVAISGIVNLLASCEGCVIVSELARSRRINQMGNCQLAHR